MGEEVNKDKDLVQLLRMQVNLFRQKELVESQIIVLDSQINKMGFSNEPPQDKEKGRCT